MTSPPQSPPFDPTNLTKKSAEPPQPTIQRTGAGEFLIGAVRILQASRTVTFPAKVNQVTGLVEYLVVTTQGPTHESVLNTTAEPLHLHMAMLALGVGTKTNSSAQPAAPVGSGAPPGTASGVVAGPTRDPVRDLISGDPVEIEVRWTQNGREVQRRAEDLVWNESSRAAMSPGPWLYNGSMEANGVLMAQGNGVFASVIADPSALINNPRPGRENDEIWFARGDVLPPVGSEVSVRIRLLPEAKTSR